MARIIVACSAIAALTITVNTVFALTNKGCISRT